MAAQRTPAAFLRQKRRFKKITKHEANKFHCSTYRSQDETAKRTVKYLLALIRNVFVTNYH